jgi:hypothetical protein
MSTRVVRIVFDDFRVGTGECLLQLLNRDLICIPLLLRMQSQTVPAYFDEPTKTVKHRLTLLEGPNECNYQRDYLADP